MTRLRIYLDDCSIDGKLVRFLRSAGHEVVLPMDVSLSGAKDDVHFNFSLSANLTFLTHNAKDFISHVSEHPGVLGVYRDNNSAKDMFPKDVVRAIENLLAAGIELRGELHSLNAWRLPAT